MRVCFAITILFLVTPTGADEVYAANKRANRLYEQGKYEEALELYEEILLESPGDGKVAMNKGSSLYRIGDFEEAEQAYRGALSVEAKKARADAFYNLGNILNMQAEQLAATGGQQTMEKLKAARDSYIKSLDLRSSDKDAKWNLQLTQMRIKELEKQQQQQKKENQDSRDQQAKQAKQAKQDGNQQQGDKNKEQEGRKEQEQQQEEEQGDQQPKPQPREQSQEEMEKEEALHLLRQYADDADELNKPKKQMKVMKDQKPEKDW